MKRRILPIFILLSVLGATSLGVAPYFSDTVTAQAALLNEDENSFQDCPGSFSEFQHSVSWYKGSNRVRIQAAEACGSKQGILKLRDVLVTVSSGSKTLTEVTAKEAIFSKKLNQLLITSAVTRPGPHPYCLTPSSIFTIDLLSGELRSSGMRVVLNSFEAPDCQGNPQ